LYINRAYDSRKKEIVIVPEYQYIGISKFEITIFKTELFRIAVVLTCRLSRGRNMVYLIEEE